MKIGWRVSKIDMKIPSVRIRALIPAYLLEAKDCRHQFYSYLEIPDLGEPFDVFVFSKAFTEVDLKIAQALHKRGTRIILDVCDNIFLSPKDQLSQSSDQLVNSYLNRTYFLKMAAISSRIVTTGTYLYNEIKSHVQNDVPIVVVADPSLSDEETRKFNAWFKEKSFVTVQSKNWGLQFIFWSLKFYRNTIVAIRDFFIQQAKRAAKVGLIIFGFLHACLAKLLVHGYRRKPILELIKLYRAVDKPGYYGLDSMIAKTRNALPRAPEGAPI
jgi:hypothetical protein